MLVVLPGLFSYLIFFILRGGLFCVMPCAIFFLCFSVLLALRLPRLGKSLCFLNACSGCACLVLSVPSSYWCLGRTAVCDCGTPWTFLLPLVCDCGTPWDFLLPFLTAYILNLHGCKSNTFVGERCKTFNKKYRNKSTARERSEINY